MRVWIDPCNEEEAMFEKAAFEGNQYSFDHVKSLEVWADRD